VTDKELAELFGVVDEMDRELASQPGGRQATFFEFTTAMAFEHFRRNQVDVVVLETGLGGRLDATNVVMPLVAVITRIDIEHVAYLGDTVEKIAVEKAGIIKPGRSVICGMMPDRAREVISRVARERRAPLIRVEDAVSIRRVSQTLRGQKIRVDSSQNSYGTMTLPLPGRHQLENAALAVAALEHVADTSPFVFDEATLKRGMESVRWPARMQVLSEKPPVILDVAHNPNGAKALAECLSELLKGKPIGLVVGLLSDKDCRGYMANIGSITKKCWAVPIHAERNMPIERLVSCIRSAGVDVVASQLPEALADARKWAIENGGAVCVAGSLFLAGEVLTLEGLGDALFAVPEDL